MTTVKKNDGWFKISNETAEAMARVNLSPYQWRVLFVIWRQTVGWRKRSDRISRSQFVEKTGIDGRHVLRTLNKLEQMNMISILRGPKKTSTNAYAFQKNYKAWKLMLNRAQIKRGPLMPNKSGNHASAGSKVSTHKSIHKRQLKETSKRQASHAQNHLKSLFLSEESPLLFKLIKKYINKVRRTDRNDPDGKELKL